MRIIIYGINYAPELTGIGKYTGEMASWLASIGHEVTVVTAPPYYPEWQIHQNYKGKLWFSETIEGVTVYRCPLYVPANVTSAKRIIHEFSFLAAVLPVWFLTLFQKKYDIVICLSPPFHLGLLPLLYAKLRGAKSITHIQDLQVDAAKDLGMIKNKHFLNIMFGIEKWILKNSTIVSTISPGMQKKIAAKGISLSKMIMFPNWVDEHAISPMPKEQSLRAEFGLNLNDKVILYSGNLGEKQGLEIIIEIAKKFASRNDVHFVIVGSGGGKVKLETNVQNEGLKNVKFYPLQPYSKLSALLAIADLHLVLQKKSASDLVMPSKLTGILAAGGCPVVTASKGTTLFELISEHNIGILVEPESAEDLYEKIEKALNSDLTLYKNNARVYVQNFLSKKNILNTFNSNLIKIQKQ